MLLQAHKPPFFMFSKIFGSQADERRHYHRPPHAGVPLPSRLLLISHIAEMQGGFANTLVIEPGSDNASRVRVV